LLEESITNKVLLCADYLGITMTMLSALLTLALLFGRLIDQTGHAYSFHRSREITDLTCIAIRPAAEELN
jgi:hypothetical protein